MKTAASDVTPFRTALAAITAPPCDAGCRWRPTCAEGRRACRAFLSYLRLAPSARRELAPPKEEPTQAFYQLCFPEGDYGEGLEE